MKLNRDDIVIMRVLGEFHPDGLTTQKLCAKLRSVCEYRLGDALVQRSNKLTRLRKLGLISFKRGVWPPIWKLTRKGLVRRSIGDEVKQTIFSIHLR